MSAALHYSFEGRAQPPTARVDRPTMSLVGTEPYRLGELVDLIAPESQQVRRDGQVNFQWTSQPPKSWLALDVVDDVYRLFASKRPMAAMDRVLGSLDSAWTAGDFELGQMILERIDVDRVDVPTLVATISIARLDPRCYESASTFVVRAKQSIVRREPDRHRQILQGFD